MLSHPLKCDNLYILKMIIHKVPINVLNCCNIVAFLNIFDQKNVCDKRKVYILMEWFILFILVMESLYNLLVIDRLFHQINF